MVPYWFRNRLRSVSVRRTGAVSRQISSAVDFVVTPQPCSTDEDRTGPRSTFHRPNGEPSGTVP